MSRSMRILVLLLLGALVLVACRREEEATEPDPTEAPAAVAPTEAPAEDPAEEPTEEPAEVPEEPMEDMGPIKVAFLGPLTGVAASLGQEMLGFAKVTVDLFNERTGLNVELVEGDTEINPDVGKIVAERLAADEDIYAVVGPAGSQVCDSTQPVFEEAGLAHITPTCTATFLTNPGTPTFFRVVPNDADQSRTAADVMVDTLGVGSVFLVDNQDTYSVNLDDEVEGHLTEKGIPFERASIAQEETDMSAIATAAISFGADAVFFPSQAIGQIGTLAVQLREQGYEGIYFLADGGFAPDWVEAAGDSAEGTYVTSFAPDPNSIASMAPYNERFAEEFTENFGAFGGATNLATFVALEAIESCIRADDISRACVVDTLTNIDLATTPMGLPIMFGEGNQAEGAFALFQVQDGQFVYMDQ